MKKMPFTVLVATVVLSLGACSDAVPVVQVHADECVVLLHGLARTSSSMERMKSFLENSGYQVANIDYPSRDYKVEELAPMAVEEGLRQCRAKIGINRVHFVTHSLGGILVRYYFSQNEVETLGRVVMLAPPNQGSAAADELQEWPGFEWLNGPAGYQLGKGEDSIPLQLGIPTFEFAVIAGDESIDPVTSAVLENPDDGRVSVADTYLDGMRDFRLVSTSHAFIMQNSDVFELIESFLETGKFLEEDGT
ncbi:MAG: alpha/beta fold hydrolase [Proteobacteria bacterium]|nr:alpha/beta fold hydrolase [Pseudomonadota bacterium]MDA0992442.1 alpha/beta fold hydrolase [Pseudomonadota bacterium]